MRGKHPNAILSFVSSLVEVKKTAHRNDNHFTPALALLFVREKCFSYSLFYELMGEALKNVLRKSKYDG
jgi:hypothetical protein